MKKILFLTLITVLVLFTFWSCGLKIPEELPENVKVEFTKHVEFPITTLDYNLKDLIKPAIEELESMGLRQINDSPLTLEYSTSLEFSAKELLTELENNVENAISQFASNMSFSFSVDDVFNTFEDSETAITLPTIEKISDSINVDPIRFSDLQIFSGLIRVSPFITNISTSIQITTNQFESIHIVRGTLSITKDPEISELEVGIKINDVEYKDGDVITDITLEDNQEITLVATYNGSETKDVDITVGISGITIDKGTGLNISDITINPNLSSISIDNKEWQLTLDGSLVTLFDFEATNLNVSSEFSVKSGSQIIATGEGTIIEFDSTKRINANDDLIIEATLTLSGDDVDIDLTSPVSYEITPNVSVKNIYNYPILFEQFIPLPDNIIETKVGTGTAILEFNGITIEDATGAVFDNIVTNNVTTDTKSLIFNFANISLPATIQLATISGEVTGNEISFEISISDDFEIERAKISDTLLSNAKQDFSYEITQDIKDFINSLDATTIINFTYNATNISGLMIRVDSNFFEDQNITINNSGNIKISNSLQCIDFNTLNKIYLTIEATGTPEISNIKKGNTYGIDISISDYTFEFDNFDIKSQTLEILPQTTIVDFSTIEFSDILSDLNFDIYMPIKFQATNTTIAATLTSVISGKEEKFPLNQEKDVGNYIRDLIKSSSPLTLAASITTDPGILRKNSIFGFEGSLRLPVAGTPTSEISLYEEKIDLSEIKPLLDILDSATLTFGVWENSTGIPLMLKLENDETSITFTIDESTPVLSVTKAELDSLIPSATISILLPKDKHISINLNGNIKVAPYILLDLKVATNVSIALEGGE